MFASRSTVRPSGAVSTGTRSSSTSGERVEEATATYLAPVQPSKIIATHLTYRSRVEEYAARHTARTVVLHEAADDAERSSRRAAAAERRPLPELRGRGRGGHRHPDARRPRGQRARLRRRLRGAPTTSASTTSATPTAARCCGSRARTGSCPIGPELVPAVRVRPDRLRAPHLPERRGRPARAGRRPDLADRLPARRPLPADHPGAGRRRPRRARPPTRGRWSRGRGRGRGRPAWAGCRTR